MKSASDSTLENGNAPAPAENTSRPKFARRPASFARESGQSPPPPAETRILPITATEARATELPTTPWQEDTRFGIVLLVLIAIVNAALVYGLPLLKHHETIATEQAATKSPTMPNALNRDGNVTLYAQPEHERRTIYLLDLRNTKGEENALGTSPDDMPVPTARALDQETSQ